MSSDDLDETNEMKLNTAGQEEARHDHEYADDGTQSDGPLARQAPKTTGAACFSKADSVIHH